MQEREKNSLKRPELPEKVDLSSARVLNQNLWRGRDRSTIITSPVEIPEGRSRPVFDQLVKIVRRLVGDGYEPDMPLVGYSILPEDPSECGVFYAPDVYGIGSVNLLEEFATDWLAKAIYGTDPYKDNAYTKRISRRLARCDFSLPEDKLLYALISSIGSGDLRKAELTEAFAVASLAGRLDVLEFMDMQFPDGTRKSFASGLRDCWAYQGNANFESRLTTFADRVILGFSRGGQVSMPGVVNLSGTWPEKVRLAHEFIHELNFHDNFWHFTPHNGYAKFS